MWVPRPSRRILARGDPTNKKRRVYIYFRGGGGPKDKSGSFLWFPEGKEESDWVRHQDTKMWWFFVVKKVSITKDNEKRADILEKVKK